MITMLRNLLGAATVSLLLGGCAGGPNIDVLKESADAVLGGGSGAALTSSDITRGLKEALSKGSSAVVGQLGQANGFSSDPVVRIPLPKSLLKARDIADRVGLAGSFDDLENRLNSAAEAATPKAKALFLSAIQDMSVDDATGILKGPDNAATEYFRDKTGASLQSQMRPLVDSALADVGAVNAFNSLMSKYRRIPGAPAVDADLTGHVVEKGSDGIFHYLAEEEKSIRTDPLARTSDILQRVFGSQ